MGTDAPGAAESTKCSALLVPKGSRGLVTSHKLHCGLALRVFLEFTQIPQVRAIPNATNTHGTASQFSFAFPSSRDCFHLLCTQLSTEHHVEVKSRFAIRDAGSLCCPRCLMGSMEVTEGRRGEEISTSLTSIPALMMSSYFLPALWLFTCSDLP